MRLRESSIDLCREGAISAPDARYSRREESCLHNVLFWDNNCQRQKLALVLKVYIRSRFLVIKRLNFVPLHFTYFVTVKSKARVINVCIESQTN